MITLTDIPEDMLRLIEPATKGGTATFMQYKGRGIGQVMKAYKFRDHYRLYIETDHGFGEHRYDKETAQDITFVIS